MKKILLAFSIMVLLAGTVKSQTDFKPTVTNPTSAITNTSVDTMNLVNLKGFASIGIQPVVTKATGTMAGTAIVYGSLDGVNFVSIGDTLTLTNVTTNTGIFTHANPVWTYFQLRVGGATTVTATVACKFSGRRPN
jgi:hypothetical protein